MKPKLEQSAAWLKKRLNDGRTIAEMADEAGCSQLTIRRRLKEKGLG